MKSFLVEAKQIGISYGAALFQQLNWTFRAGENVILVGPNGSGKTSLGRLLAGIPESIAKTEGSVSFDKMDLRHLPSIERVQKVSYLPSDLHLQTGLTVGDFLALARFWEGGSHEDLVVKVLLDLRANTWINQPICTLSNGQRQIVLFALALLQDSEFTVFDETFSYLDQEYLALIRTILLERSRGGKSHLIITHDGTWSVLQGSKLMVLSKGRLKERNQKVPAFFDLSDAEW